MLINNDPFPPATSDFHIRSAQKWVDNNPTKHTIYRRWRNMTGTMRHGREILAVHWMTNPDAPKEAPRLILWRKRERDWQTEIAEFREIPDQDLPQIQVYIDETGVVSLFNRFSWVLNPTLPLRTRRWMFTEVDSRADYPNFEAFQTSPHRAWLDRHLILDYLFVPSVQGESSQDTAFGLDLWVCHSQTYETSVIRIALIHQEEFEKLRILLAPFVERARHLLQLPADRTVTDPLPSALADRSLAEDQKPFLNEEQTARLMAVLNSEETSFAKLGEIAGLNPAEAYVGANLSKTNFGTDDLTGFVFREADLRNCNLSSTVGLTTEVVDGAIHDETTKWPQGFVPPPSRTPND